MPTGGNERHPLAMVGCVYRLYSLDPTMMLNRGLVRPCRAILPEGTVMNAVTPAAVGMRSLMCNSPRPSSIGAFRRASRPPAGLAGQRRRIMNVKTSTRGGRTVMASIGPVGGGAGGGPYADGDEGCGANMSYLKNTPVEINEAEVPMRSGATAWCRIRAAPGASAAASALEMEFQLFAPQSMVTARNRDRSIFSAWGLRGGMPGLTSRFAKQPGHRSLCRARFDRHRALRSR